MNRTITKTNFNFPNQTNVYKGKVREVYTIDNDKLVMIATDRLSAFDVIMPKGIPYKGQILNQIATKMMKATEDLVPNWLIDTPDPNVAIGHLCTLLKLKWLSVDICLDILLENTKLEREFFVELKCQTD